MPYANGTLVKPKKEMIRLCKLCSKTKRFRNRTLCFGCLRTQERNKKMEKAKARLLRKVSSKKYQESEWKKWHKKAWTVFSQWTRRKNADWRGFVRCYTCPDIKHYKEMDAGHLFHGRQDFNPLNIHPQCTTCNKFHSGRREEYSANLIQEIGQERFLELRRIANTEQKMTVEELKGVFEKYSQLIKGL